MLRLNWIFQASRTWGWWNFMTPVRKHLWSIQQMITKKKKKDNWPHERSFNFSPYVNYNSQLLIVHSLAWYFLPIFSLPRHRQMDSTSVVFSKYCHGDCQCYCYNNNSFINNIVWRAIIISLILIFIFKCEKKGAGSCWSGLFVHIMMYNRTLDHVDGIRGVCGDCRRWTSSHFPPFLPSTYINQKHNTLH